jgi:uracil-DNA glycosylase family 4
MTSRREEMLKEMGLSPLWTLREGVRAPIEPMHSVAFEETQEAISPSPVAIAPEAPRSALDDERRASIMQMDWLALKASVAECVMCPLHAKRNKTVFGVGDENADWMFVGEGPGADEDALGDPFVGQAGRLLDNMLAAIGLRRGEDVYIANIVKCRPPGNRNPEPAEAEKCEPFLQRQIELVKPKLIVALGRIPAQNLLGREATIASLRGRVLDYKGIPLLVTYHPAYLLRTLTDKAKAWQDLCFAVRTMRGLAAKPMMNAE